MDEIARSDQVAAAVRDLAQIVYNRARNTPRTVAIAYTVELDDGELTVRYHHRGGFTCTVTSAELVSNSYRLDPTVLGVNT